MVLERTYHAAVVHSRITVEGTVYDTYGIEVCCGEEYAVVHDISVDRADVEVLCRRIRDGRLAPCHLQAVAEEFVDR